MKVLVVCILLATVSVAFAAEVDFVRQRSNGAIQSPGGRPISVPVVHSQRNGAQDQQDGQKKRQLELPATARQNGANTAAFRQQAAVPLQQPFRPAASRPSGAGPSAAAARPEHEQPQRSNPSFADQHQPSQAFVPFNEAGEQPVRPQRQSTGARPALPFPSSSERKSPPASRGNPEFERGFPDGFTSGLPAFDFQGRMPEPDEKSEGFMDGALQNFPSLKNFGGFDPLPDIAREDTVGLPVKRPQSSSFQGSGRPSGSRPSSQLTGFRPSAN